MSDPVVVTVVVRRDEAQLPWIPAAQAPVGAFNAAAFYSGAFYVSVPQPYQSVLVQGAAIEVSVVRGAAVEVVTV